MRNGLLALGGGEPSRQIRMSIHLYAKIKVCNLIFIGYKLIIRGEDKMHKINIKKWLLFLTMCLMLMFLTVGNAWASDGNKLDLSKADFVLETSNSEIGIAFYSKDNKSQSYLHKAAGRYLTTSRTGKGYFYKTSDNSKIADFDCKGTFSYERKICNVTGVSTSMYKEIEGYRIEVSESKNQISPTFARATGVFNLYVIGFFSEKLTSSATINVYCNQNGETEVEFNGDKN